MLKLITPISLIMLLIITACTPQNSNSPTLDTSNVQSILPTISPVEVMAYAELADDETLALGEQVYQANCASCHGDNGEGQFPNAPLQADETGKIGAPPHTGDGHTWHHDDDLLYRIIRNGGSGSPSMFYPMPAFDEQLNEQEIEAVLAYIKTMWTEEQRLIQAQRSLQVQQQNQ